MIDLRGVTKETSKVTPAGDNPQLWLQLIFGHTAYYTLAATSMASMALPQR
jgi:hypothetical protein